MHGASAAALLATLACASAFVPAPLARMSRVQSAAPMRMALKEEDWVPSELFMQEYLGQDGLRYSMGKTPKEIQEEGDYGFFEAIFGQTSNNAAKKELKKKARESAQKVLYTEESKTWLEKYGYPRFFPAYVDKSGDGDDAPVAVAAAPAAKAEPVAAKAAPAPKAAPTKAAPVAAAAPKVSVTKAVTKSVPKAGRVVVSAKPAAPAAAAPSVTRSISRPAAKPKGNLANLPKKSSS